MQQVLIKNIKVGTIMSLSVTMIVLAVFTNAASHFSANLEAAACQVFTLSSYKDRDDQ